MWIVDQEHAGLRLDVLVKEVHPEFSRSKIQNFIKQGLVTVNGETEKPHYAVRDGDDILAELPAPEVPDLSPNPEVQFSMIAQTDDYAVVDKPSGLLVHPYEGYTTPDTLVNGLLAQFPEMQYVGEDELRPGIVHRLDREVSGVMIVARTQEMFSWLKAQFRDRTTEKEYLAMVFGPMEHIAGRITMPIARSKSDPKRMAAHPAGSDVGREAITEYEVIDQTDNFAFLRIVIKTGRTHQIRVHMNAIGHPILGDTLYAPKRKHPIDRIFLHSHRLAFTELDEDRKIYTSPLPPELFQFSRDKQLDFEHRVI